MEAPAISADEVEALRPLMGLGWLDTYQVVREVESGRDARGAVTTTIAAVEVGPCSLRAIGNQPQESAVAGRIQASEPNAVDLPWNTTLTAADDLTVNGTSYEVHGVHRPGQLGLYATAVVSRGTS